VFGSLYFAQSHVKGKDKSASRCRKCVFVEYPFEKKGWKLYDLDNQGIFVSRDVIFHKNIFPFRDTKSENTFEEDPGCLGHNSIAKYDEVLGWIEQQAELAEVDSRAQH